LFAVFVILECGKHTNNCGKQPTKIYH